MVGIMNPDSWLRCDIPGNEQGIYNHTSASRPNRLTLAVWDCQKPGKGPEQQHQRRVEAKDTALIDILSGLYWAMTSRIYPPSRPLVSPGKHFQP